MIEKMKMVCVVSSASRKDEMLEGLRNLGVLHLSEKKSPEHAISERFTSLSKTASVLAEYAPDKKAQKEVPLLSDEQFEEMYQEVLEATDKMAALVQEQSVAAAELDRLSAWGDFSPAEIINLKQEGCDLHFYRIGKKEYAIAAQDPDIQMIRLASVDKMDTVAVVGSLPAEIPATEFLLPEKGISELERELERYRQQMAACEAVLKKASVYDASFQVQLLKTQNEETLSAARETAEADEDFVWISGYLPEAELPQFKATAAVHKWAWACTDVAEDDTQIPTKVKYGKISGLIKPVFDILGILPGYRETDISMWFLLFFTLFFAMIIGDAGYGVLILLGTIAYAVKTKGLNNGSYLLIVLSVATILWGAVTGTWFGLEKAMEVPLLRAMVIPSFANYPEYFGVTALTQQNAIMKFSFSIGAVQMAIGSLIAVRRKIAEKNLSWVADLGWLVAIVAMYLLSLYLVIGEDIPVVPVFVLIGAAYILVVLFGGMSPDRTFAQGLKAGCADAFTVFLNTISCFGNVMSYIRLFAVGMAGLAISQSFNGIAAGFEGPLMILGVCVVLIGHGLNLIMCFLSVVVHGVRLNVLEFSGQAGLEWTGIEYEPFRLNDKIRK
ncbi:MAG: hypothetical protein IKU09_10745 [Firmicutes bacterium]|nr:hypothetical protein [Bacillota bacterium]